MKPVVGDFHAVGTTVSYSANTQANLSATKTSNLALQNVNVSGSSGNDVLTSTDAIITLAGDGGNDSYKFTTAQTSETIINGLSNNSSPTGELDFGYNAYQLWFRQSGNNLVVDVLGTTKQADIKNWFADIATTSWEQLAKITSSDGLEISIASAVNNLVHAMAMFEQNNASFNPSAAANTTITDPTVLAAVSSSWHH